MFMNNTRYYSKFINSNTNARKSITTFTNHFYFSFITGMLRGQRLPLSIFSQPVGVVSSMGQSELGKPMSSVKELFSSIVNFQIGLSAFSNLSMVLLAIQIRGVQLKCLSISKMNIVDNQTSTRLII